jgi:hypothetical protein
MAPSQTILFTIIPRGISLNPDTLPVSVFVSPRLLGANRLDAFPDWLNWTARRQDIGLRLVLECAGLTREAEIPREQLRPELWRALFNEETFVRSHTFDDYSGRFVASYPVRAALSALKGVYQAAGVALAQPQLVFGGRGQEGGHGQILARLVDGFQVDWDIAKGRKLREDQRQGQGRLNIRGPFLGYSADDLDDDGAFRTGGIAAGSKQSKQLNQAVAERFAVFSHQPAGAPVTRERLDERTVLDFHQALSSLDAYPALQRMLGLVFDFELPIDFVAAAPFGAAGTIRVVQADGSWDDATPTIVPATATAYIHITGENRLFFTAPRATIDKNNTSEPLGALGLLALDPTRFGLAQVDVDGGLHKTITLAEMANQTSVQGPLRAQHPQVFDPNTALAALRSGGISMYADNRALALLSTFGASKKLNDALEANQAQPFPFAAEDLARGYRIDVWDAATGGWHSLHRRDGVYHIGDNTVATEDEEGFIQLAATQAAPNEDGMRDTDDLYLHEAFARWPGWSLSAPRPGKHLTRAADPDQAVPDENAPDPENEPITPFKITADYQVVRGSLPRLRFGGRYRFRARLVDLAGNSLGLGETITDLLSLALSLPRGSATFPYLRFEPIPAPALVLRDERGISGPGSSLERIVIRSFNSDLSLDAAPADLTANDRHIAPPRGNVELGERHGMFDDASGKLKPSPAMWDLIRKRDEGQFATATVASLAIDGQPQPVPLDGAAQLDLPYLPDPLSRGAAFRDLPGTPSGSIGRADPTTAAGPLAHTPLEDANPRPGSATLIGWGGQDDWQHVAPFRFALEEGDGLPSWDPDAHVLTVFLAKGQTSVVPISSIAGTEDLKLMGVWQWLREFIEYLTTEQAQPEFVRPFATKDRIAHILQRAVEGGHAMLTPPQLLTLVHAVQQPIGQPQFTRLNAQLDTERASELETEPEYTPTAATELDTISAWRELGSTDARLIGGLSIHGASTAKVDLRAAWVDPVDDLLQDAPGTQSFATFVDSVPLPNTSEQTLLGEDGKHAVGYYDADHDLLCFARAGTKLGNLASGETVYSDAAPRHQIGDTRHHVIEYTAVATSRYREYFPQQQDGADLDFTRTSLPVRVDVPASARPLAPQVRYVVPTFGWQRETSTNLTRSLRVGGGLRIYLDRPWYSSGEGELLGVALHPGGALDREQDKPYITQWGQDPIWVSAPLDELPRVDHFPDAVASEFDLPMDARTKDSETRHVNVAGHTVAFDCERKLWYCDLTVNTKSSTYAPFVRLALVRYQPHALIDAKLSRAVLADFVQLTPERAAMITADPNQSGRLRVVVTGPAPRGPRPAVYQPRTAPEPTTSVDRPTVISVAVQERDPAISGELGWRAAAPGSFSLNVEHDGPLSEDENLRRWAGTIRFADLPAPGQFRLLITEREYISADYTVIREQDNARVVEQPSRLIYAETIALDTALLAPPNIAAASTIVG